ncbi:phosphate transporter family protein [Dictyocaulus viviparus]|uniref:Phosphate transporter family protein n=1 Tax=Dictyocaulus viviparus TaxID=29172 RepID=A0A0D8XHQ6_DICVI|nr:phosphate transporter family protein [Dictyocaulus viviparus]
MMLSSLDQLLRNMETLMHITSIAMTTTDITILDREDPLELFQPSALWILIVGIVVAFLLGAGLGANDVSNTFGTSVGSGVLSAPQAYTLASIFITLGSVLVGWSVTDMMRKGVIDVSEYSDSPRELMLGQVAILGGTSAWLAITTAARMPVSTTHALVGSTLGFSLVLRGTEGINWSEIFKIIASWFLSPALSGMISLILYLAVDIVVLRRKAEVVKPGASASQAMSGHLRRKFAIAFVKTHEQNSVRLGFKFSLRLRILGLAQPCRMLEECGT